MIDYAAFFRQAAAAPLAPWAQALQSAAHQAVITGNNGDLPGWQAALQSLPDVSASRVQLNQDTVTFGAASDCDGATRERLEAALRVLMPWRKGPFQVYGIPIDTEWRSDWKWQRLQAHITPLRDRIVLDVGCGNGYHCWRMLGAGARLVLGIDPTLLYLNQFEALSKLAGEHPVTLLPLKSEQLPAQMAVFDTVFSMGVLYHRRSPFDHLQELRDALRPQGELVLETLVIDGIRGQVLVPDGRYAQMNNVWFLPSCAELTAWLQRAGFADVRLVDINQTSCDEQRSTDWMIFESLADFLHPDDRNRTIENHPAPKRAIFVARKK